MDFQTMVSTFKRSVLEEEENKLDELSSDARERVRKYMRQGTPGRHTPKYSFAHLFKDVPGRWGDTGPMRLALPMDTSIKAKGTQLFKRIIDQGWKPHFTFKTVTQKRQRLADEGGGVEEVEIELPVLNMKKEKQYVIPKGPRAGEKILKAETTSLGKLVAKLGSEEDKKWWQENQNSLREMDNVQDYFLRPWFDDFAQVEEEPPVIVISRHPIDVARMSDFGLTRSCHSEGSSHFGCAIAESKGHGMVAYLVKREDYETIKDNLQDDEIFGDRDVGQQGPSPIARVRLRKLYNDETGQEFATVEDRVYGRSVPDFLPAVRKWARESQKDMWLGEDGKIDPGALGSGEWIMVGGEYLDTQIDDQLIGMFEDTEWDQQATDIWNGAQYEHEDYFSEGAESMYDEAVARVEAIDTSANQRAQHGSYYISVEEGWDDMPFYVQAGYSAEWRFPIPHDWFGSTGHGRSSVPEYSDSWQLRRDFEGMLDRAFDKANVYQGFNAEWEYGEEDDEIVIRYREDAEITQLGADSIDEADNWVDYSLDDTDAKWPAIRLALRALLITEEYLPPGTYQKAEEELPEMEFDNLEVFYDEDEPEEGIQIRFKEDYLPVGSYKKNDKTGRNIAGDFAKRIHSGAVKTTVNAAVRTAFKRLARAAEKAAAKQMQFQFPQAQAGLFGTPADPRYQRPDPKMPEMPLDEFTVFYGMMEDPEGKDYVSIGLRGLIEIGIEINDQTYQVIKTFVDYLDKNIKILEQAAKKVADNAYEWASAQFKPEDSYETISGTAVVEDALREAIRKALKKRLMKEQTGFETRLFQVNLKIQIDPNMGGGIEQKLNRIRAIEGVTVVGHDEIDKRSGRSTIEARIKFHPESDALRPGTYVSQVLVPNINSSKQVPGVKVIDIVKGTLKRLDK